MDKRITGYWDDSRNDENIPLILKDQLLPYAKSEIIHDQLAGIWRVISKKYRSGESYGQLRMELEEAFASHADAYLKTVTHYVMVCEKYGSKYDTLNPCPTKKQEQEQDEYNEARKDFGNTPRVRVHEDLGLSELLWGLAMDLAAGPPYRFGFKTIRAKVQEICLLLIESDHETSLGNVNSAAFIQYEARRAFDELLVIHEANYFEEQHSPLKANGGNRKKAELQKVKNEVIRLLHDLCPEQGWKSAREAADAMRDRLAGEIVNNDRFEETKYGPITLFQRKQGLTAGLSSYGMERTLKNWMGKGKDADAEVHEAFEATKDPKA